MRAYNTMDERLCLGDGSVTTLGANRVMHGDELYPVAGRDVGPNRQPGRTFLSNPTAAWLLHCLDPDP